MESINRQYRQNLERANKKNPDLRKWKGKVMEGKDLEFFKGISNLIKNQADDVMAQGYDTNSMTNLERLLGNFNTLYNAYYEQIVRNPQNKLSEPMRGIIDDIKKILSELYDISPQYARRLQDQLNILDDMYRRTGGQILKGVPTPSYLSGGGLGTYNGDVPVDINQYEPSLEERIASQQFLPQWKDKPYRKLQMNNDYN